MHPMKQLSTSAKKALRINFEGNTAKPATNFELTKRSNHNVKKMPSKKRSRKQHESYLPKNIMIKNIFSRVMNTKMHRLFWWIDLKFRKNMQQAQMGSSFLILGDRLVRLLHNIRISRIRTITKLGGATISQLFITVEFVNLRKVASIMIIIETNNVLRRQKMMAAFWKIECLLSENGQKIQCLVMQNQQELMTNYEEGIRHERPGKLLKTQSPNRIQAKLWE